MVSRSVYGTRQIGGPGAVDRRSSTHRGACWPGRAASACCERLDDLNDAQRAPSATHGIADAFYKCAQTLSATPAKSSMFTGGFERATVQKTVASAAGRQYKISIREVLILVTLNLRGEVAERPKAAVC